MMMELTIIRLKKEILFTLFLKAMFFKGKRVITRLENNRFGKINTLLLMDGNLMIVKL